MDGIVAIFVSPIMIDAYEVARAIAAAADGSKPVLSRVHGEAALGRRACRSCAAHRVPVYRFPEEAAVGHGRHGQVPDAA